MFKLHRHKSDRLGERVEFRFSSFQAFQIPRGWDRLVLFLVSVETGKTKAKSNKAMVRSGTCQWTETFSESIWILQGGASKEIEDCVFKLVVSMGSHRSGILGELIINLTDYMSSNDSGSLSLPLQKCNYGTLVQVRIQCLNPKRGFRVGRSSKEASYLEESHMNNANMDRKSNGSDNKLNRSLESSSNNHSGVTYPDEPVNRDTSFSASGSQRSSDSGDSAIGKLNFSPRNNLNGGSYTRRQDSADDYSRSNPSSFNSRASGSSTPIRWHESHGVPPISLRPSSSKDFLEAAEETIEELQDEAKMWERHAQKLKLDIEKYKKENSDKSKRQAELDMELSAVCSERDSLKQETEQLKLSLEEATTKQTATRASKSEVMVYVQKELEDEVKFLKESNASLRIQLKKSQEANIELVSILEELEETVEKQRVELANFPKQSPVSEYEGEMWSQKLLDVEAKWGAKLSAKEEEIKMLQEKLSGILNAECPSDKESSHDHLDLMKEIEILRVKVQELESDCAELTDENLEFMFKLKKSGKDINEKEDSKNSDSEVNFLKSQVHRLEEELRIKEMLNGGMTEPSAIQIKSLEKRCADLEVELQYFKLDIEKYKKEISDKSKRQAELDMELSAACSERDSLKQETEQLKISLEEVTTKQTATRASKSEVMVYVQKEFEDEVKFLKESNASLSIQLKKSQDANIELVSILEELEETVEKQRVELANFPKQSPVSEYEGEMWCKKLLDVEAKWGAKLSAKEEEIKMLQEKLSGILNAECPSDKESSHDHLDLMKEIEILRVKVQELESDCAELTDENLEFMFKLKKSGKDINEKEDSKNSDSEVNFFKSQVHRLEEELRIKEMLNGGMTEPSAIQIKSLEKRCADLEVELQYFKDHACHLDTKLRESQLEVEGKISELSELQKNLETFQSTTSKQSAENESDLEELKSALFLKVKEIDILQNAKEELEVLLTDIQRDKSQLEEDLTSVLRESSITSKCLEDVQHEMVLLASRVGSHTSTNKMLERKLMELECSKHELEIQVSGLDEVNAQLSEPKLGLEAQLRYLTNEKESKRLEVETTLSLVANLKDKVSKQQAEIDAQMGELEQKLIDAQERMSETQQEIEYLKRSNSKLQSTLESHIEENNSLQKSNGELRKQMLELHEHNLHLEVELSESQEKTSEFLRKVEFLEIELSSVQNEIISREKIITSQLESILKEHEDQEEKISGAKLMLNQIGAEKTVEIENLKREVAHLSSQLCATQDERQRTASDAVLEVSNLRSDKIKLESSLQDAHAKIKQCESELKSLRQESGKKVQGLVDLLNASKQTEQILMSGIQRQTQAANSGEEKFKRVASELELKLKASEFDKQQILEETSSLKVQLQKIAHLQDEIFFIKSSLEEAKSEKGKLEELLQSVSEQCEGLKTERISFMEKISNMQKSLQDGEDERRSRIALEEKLLGLEEDLSAKEALYVHEAELKDEINRMKAASSEYQRKIQCLEEEKCELMSKVQVLEEENQDKIVPDKDDSKLHDFEARIQDLEAKICMLEKELAESLETNNMYKIQLQGFLAEEQGKDSEILKQNVSENNTGSQHSNKIASLETELKEMKERYLNMSLQYAEVEAQREQLVMKLKTTGKGKGWFA